ncbi:MAG: polysaccharide deacetylase family protein [Candidatus Lambdaproteobacteria bacterium]
MREIQVVFGIDMETDIGSWTPFYEGVTKGTPLLLNLFAKKSIPVTAFWVADTARRFPEIVREMESAGHETGTHSLYHETVGDSLFEIPGTYPLLPEEVQPRIKLATDILEDIVGHKVVSWRCPRLFGGTHVTNALEALGYECDATYPMYFYNEQLFPYHPSHENWTEQGSLNLIEIIQFADMEMESKDEYGRDKDQWPLYRTQSTEDFIPHIESFMSYLEKNDQSQKPIVLCFYFHPWEFWEMPKGVIHFGEGGVLPDPFLTKGCGKYCLNQVELLIDWLKSKEAAFLTAGQCARKWHEILALQEI